MKLLSLIIVSFVFISEIAFASDNVSDNEKLEFSYLAASGDELTMEDSVLKIQGNEFTHKDLNYIVEFVSLIEKQNRIQSRAQRIILKYNKLVNKKVECFNTLDESRSEYESIYNKLESLSPGNRTSKLHQYYLLEISARINVFNNLMLTCYSDDSEVNKRYYEEAYRSTVSAVEARDSLEAEFDKIGKELKLDAE